MVLLAESLSTLSWAALMLTVSLCVRERERDRKRARGRKKILSFARLSQTRSEGLCTIYLQRCESAGWRKSWTSFTQGFISFWAGAQQQVNAVLESEGGNKPDRVTSLKKKSNTSRESPNKLQNLLEKESTTTVTVSATHIISRWMLKEKNKRAG